MFSLLCASSPLASVSCNRLGYLLGTVKWFITGLLEVNPVIKWVCSFVFFLVDQTTCVSHDSHRRQRHLANIKLPREKSDPTCITHQLRLILYNLVQNLFVENAGASLHSKRFRCFLAGFSLLVGRKLGREQKHFSRDQMRRSNIF